MPQGCVLTRQDSSCFFLAKHQKILFNFCSDCRSYSVCMIYIYTHTYAFVISPSIYIHIYIILNSVTTFTNHVHVYTYPKLSLSVLTCNPLSNFDCRCVTWLDGFALCTFCFLSFWHFRSDPESLKYEGGDRTIVKT